MECHKYKKNYLTKVILQIKFPQILALNENNPPSKFQNFIMRKFPYVNVIKGEDVSLDLKPSNAVINRKKNFAWEFQSKDHKRKVVVNEKNLSIQFDNYKGFDDFFDTIKYIFEKFTDIYDIGIFNIGLRYINEINDQGNYRNWKGQINKSLTSISGEFVGSHDEIMRSMHVLELKEEDYKFRFQFGLFNSLYPNPITKKEFALDYDCISIEDLEKSEVYDTIKNFHQIIYEWFEKSIEDGLRKKMGEL